MILEYHVLTRSSIAYASGKIYCAIRIRNAAHSGNKTEANLAELSLRLVVLKLRDQTSTALLIPREKPVPESKVTWVIFPNRYLALMTPSVSAKLVPEACVVRELAKHILGDVHYKGLLR